MGKLPPPPLLKHLLQRSGKSDLTWADWYQKVQAGIITGAPTDASYVTTKANSSLSSEINLGALASGFVQSAASGGVATLSTTPTIPQSAGGTGINSATATDGQLLIGRSSDHSLHLAAIAAGLGISVTNGPSSITLGNTAFAAVQVWTPVWQNGGTANVLGNGSISGWYLQFGKLVLASIALVFGSTTIVGNGAMFFNLPFTAGARGAGDVISTGLAQHAGVGGYPILANSGGATTVVYPITLGQPAIFLSAGVPFTWGSADQLWLSFLYFAA